MKLSAEKVLVPFYRGAVVFQFEAEQDALRKEVLVPFYRGAVVFQKLTTKLNQQ